MNLLINNHEIIDEFNSYLEARPQTSELMLTDDDMQVIFKCSRMTLYRARRAGKLVSENDTSGRIVYPYSTAHVNLLFDNDLYGKMYDIRAFMLLQNKSLETRINKEDETVHFKIEDKSFSIPIEEVSIRSFLHSSGMRTNNDELSINKAKGAAKDWNDVLQLEADTESKYSVRR